MEQIRQILSQLALHLELNIAMCDKLDEMEKRLKKVENGHEALSVKHNALSTKVSELFYANSSLAYEKRTKGTK